jgi:nucleotide-binding universal stress UspA family protein
MAPERQKLLVAVDGSEQSREVVRYVAGICAPKRIEVTLFHVLSPVSESFRDLRTAPESAITEPYRGWLARHQTAMEAFMDGARRMLCDSGFPDEAVRVVLQLRQEGIARDILQEARRGYKAVAVGRVGRNPITRLVMGSVASKLVSALTQVTLWLVDGRPDCRRVLVCIDASPAAACVIDLVGRMLSDSPAEITLFHAIRNPEPDLVSESDTSAGEAAAEQELRARKALVPVFEKAVASLEAADISSERISVKVISGMATRGGTLYAQALDGDFGTIIVGRRGVSNVTTFPIGRVPMKLIQLMNEQTVWVVSC